MNFEHLERALLENLRSMWRIKFALTAAKNVDSSPSMPVSYSGLPTHTPSDLFSPSETVAQAGEALIKLSDIPLATTFFLASIAHYEGFLQDNVTTTKSRPMLGGLQAAAEGNPSKPIRETTRKQGKEVRVRRNLLIHCGGVADQEYVTAAIDAGPLSGGVVAVVAPGTVVEITPAYFTYATTVLIDYCRQVAGSNV